MVFRALHRLLNDKSKFPVMMDGWRSLRILFGHLKLQADPSAFSSLQRHPLDQIVDSPTDTAESVDTDVDRHVFCSLLFVDLMTQATWMVEDQRCMDVGRWWRQSPMALISLTSSPSGIFRVFKSAGGSSIFDWPNVVAREHTSTSRLTQCFGISDSSKIPFIFSPFSWLW